MILQVEAQRRFDGPPTRNHRIGLERPRHCAESIVDRSARFLQHELIGPSEKDTAGLARFASFDENEVVVTNALVDDLVCRTCIAGIESFVALNRRQGKEDLSARYLGDALDVLLVDPADSHNASLDQVLHRKIIDALRGEDCIHPGVQDLLDLFLGDVHLLLPYSLELLRVVDDDVYVHGHAMLLQVKIQQGNLRWCNPGRHFLRSPHYPHRVSVGDQHGLVTALAVRLEHIDLIHRVLCLALWIHDLHSLDSVNDDLTKHGTLRANELRGQRRLGDVHQGVLFQRVHLQAEVLLYVLDGLAHGDAISRDNRRWVDVVLYQIIGPL
mmetsp:Transcript_139231/g.197150  ORF Transcript_139231/g.197150 Transcript_139231/m.197150 type:complete len:327 (-) Transcript_139231:324-1304(-)